MLVFKRNSKLRERKLSDLCVKSTMDHVHTATSLPSAAPAHLLGTCNEVLLATTKIILLATVLTVYIFCL